MSKKHFSVIEYANHFAIQHNRTGHSHPLGDGVDAVVDPLGNTLNPGSPNFVQTWELYLNSDVQETMAAYFPDLILADDIDALPMPDINALGILCDLAEQNALEFEASQDAALYEEYVKQRKAFQVVNDLIARISRFT